MVNQGVNLSLNELKLMPEHRNISEHENKSAKDLKKNKKHSEGQDQGLELKRIS